MGMDARAYLFYGFVVEEGEGFSIPDEWDGDWENYYQKTFKPEVGRWSKDFTPEQSREYWEKYSAFQKSLNVEIRHTEYDCFMLFIKDSLITAYWCDATEITSLATRVGWEAQLKDFCEKMKIPYQEPKWRLCATYD